MNEIMKMLDENYELCEAFAIKWSSAFSRLDEKKSR